MSWNKKTSSGKKTKSSENYYGEKSYICTVDVFVSQYVLKTRISWGSNYEHVTSSYGCKKKIGRTGNCSCDTYCMCHKCHMKKRKTKFVIVGTASNSTLAVRLPKSSSPKQNINIMMFHMFVDTPAPLTCLVNILWSLDLPPLVFFVVRFIPRDLSLPNLVFLWTE